MPLTREMIDSVPVAESFEEIQALLKAMEASEGVTDVSQLTGAGALQPQSLEASVVSLLFDQSYFKVLNRIHREPESSTLAQYNVRTSYGRRNRGGFVGQSENSRQADPSFKRRTADIKYIRELWSVSSVLSATKTVTDTELEAVDAALMRGMETAERAFFFGNPAMVGEEWKGLEATLAEQSNSSQLIIDMRGDFISESVLKEAARRIASATGLANDFYMSYGIQTGFDNMLTGANAQRYVQNMAGDVLNFDLGHSINGFRSTFSKDGRLNFIPSFFLDHENSGIPMIEDQNGNLVEGSTSDMAPSTPIVTVSAIAPTVPGSKWKASGAAPAGAYGYRVYAENRFGSSKATVPVTATVAANGSIELTIKETSSVNMATAYTILRETASGNGEYREMTRVARNIAGDTVYADLNDDIPGTSKAFMGDFNSRGANSPLRTTQIKELVGFHKTRYSVVGPYNWGAVSYYATPVFYAPSKFIMFKNVKATV